LRRSWCSARHAPCTATRDPRKKNFAQRAQTATIVDVGEETKGYSMYLPKDRVVVTTQHIKNIESVNKEQNLPVQRLYLQGYKTLEHKAPASEDRASVTATMNARGKKKKKKSRSREHHVTRSVARTPEV